MPRQKKTHPRLQARGCASVKNHPAFYISDEALSLLMVIGGGFLAGYLFCVWFGILPMP